jgi:type I restriction enzyme S subunit
MSARVDYPLPKGWCWASIEDMTSYVQRGKSPKYAAQSAMPVINQKCIRWHGVQAEHLKFIDPSQWDAWGLDRTLRDGDILWNSTGTGTIGRAAIYRPLGDFARVVADSHVTIVRAKIGPPEYLHAWIRSPVIQSRIDDMQSGSTNQVELARTEVLRTRVPVAPLNEQRRIVSKLRALQARSRRAREALDAVPPLLEKLRQSILAAAFRGDLTKDWRAKRKDVEPASELLNRIRIERRKKWEETEVAKMNAKGRSPTDDRWKAQYNEPEPVDVTGLPELPVGWCWASLHELTFIVGGVTKGQKRKGTEILRPVPYLRVANVQRGHLDLAEVKRIDATEEEVAELRLLPGDVLLNEGGDRDKLGRGWIWERQLAECIHQNHVFRARPVVSDLQSKYISHYANHLGQSFFIDHGKQTTNLASVSMSRVRRFPIALPCVEEQAMIIALLDDQLARASSLGGAVRTMREQIAVLDRSTLSLAFRGGLVPQDPNDEDAETALARVHGTNGIPKKGDRGTTTPKRTSKGQRTSRCDA